MKQWQEYFWMRGHVIEEDVQEQARVCFELAFILEGFSSSMLLLPRSHTDTARSNEEHRVITEWPFAISLHSGGGVSHRSSWGSLML